MSFLEQIGNCIEVGKIDATTPFPPKMAGEPGASELTKRALDCGVDPNDVLRKALVPAMERVGQRFARGEIFIPQMLISAKAMTVAMHHLKPFFQSGEVKRKGTVVIGTVAGDLHDIGKNLVGMIIEGGGFEIVDLGTDVSAEKFVHELREHPGAAVGMSAMLTTTMVHMEAVTREVKEALPGTRVLIGGAPVTEQFKERIGADFYGPEPQSAVSYLDAVISEERG